MKGHGSKMGRKSEAAIAALLSHRSVEEAARAVEVAPQTLYRWLKNPEFDESYKEAKRAAFGQAVARLQQASAVAVTMLLKIMIDPSAPAAVKVRAAAYILHNATRAIEIEHVEERLATVEREMRQA